MIDSKINTRLPRVRCINAADQMEKATAMITVSTPLSSTFGSTVSAGSPPRMARADASGHDS